MENLEKIILKAFDAQDEGVVDEKGRYIIFRNINGKVVPIHTDAVDFADHLQQSGINIDPSNQSFLDDLDKQLEELSKIRMQSPELSIKYEKALEDKLRVMTGFHQQKMEAKHGEKAPEKEKELQQQLKENEGSVVKRSSLPNKGWSDYLNNYIKNALKPYPPESKAGMVLAAYGVVLQHGLKHSMNGSHPSGVSFTQMLKEVSDDYMQSENIEAINNANGLPSHQNRVKVAQGIRLLQAALGSGLKVGKDLEKSFDESYSAMHGDFNKSNVSPVDIGDIALPQGRVNNIPEQLPPNLSERELASLQSIFRDSASKGGDLYRRTHKIADHLVSRLIDTFPTGKERYLTQAVSKDLKNTLPALHKKGFDAAIQYDDPQLHPTVESLFNTIITEAADAIKTGTEISYLSTIQKIAIKLGELDGYRAKAEYPSGKPRDYTKVWENSMLGEYRSGGSPSLENLVSSPATRTSALVKNDVLKIPWKPTIKTTEQSPNNTNITPDSFEPSKEITEPSAQTTPQKLERIGSEIKTPDGSFSAKREGQRVILRRTSDNKEIHSIPVGDDLKGIIEKLSPHVESANNTDTSFELDFPDPTDSDLVEHNHELYGSFSKTSPHELKSQDGWKITSHLDEYGVANFSLFDPENHLVSSERISDDENPSAVSEEKKIQALSQLSNMRTDIKFPVKNASSFFDYSNSPDYEKIREFHSWVESSGLSIKKTGDNVITILKPSSTEKVFVGIAKEGNKFFYREGGDGKKPEVVSNLEKLKGFFVPQQENSSLELKPIDKSQLVLGEKSVTYMGNSLKFRDQNDAKVFSENPQLLQFLGAFNISSTGKEIKFTSKTGTSFGISATDYYNVHLPKEKVDFIQNILKNNKIDGSTDGLVDFIRLVCKQKISFDKDGKLQVS